MSTFAQDFGLDLPLVQAPMAGSTTPALVAAACNAGALGSFGAGYTAPEAIIERAREIRALTSRPFALNLMVLPDEFVPDMAAVTRARRLLDALMEREGLAVRTTLPARWAPRFSDQFAALCEARPAVASFVFGLLDAARVAELKRRGIRVVGTATTPAEAVAWAERGAAAVCVQGAEAGGHRGDFDGAAAPSMIGLFALVPQARHALAAAGHAIPVIAAGGIMDGAGMRAAEVLGAAASQLGTAFLACPESAAADAWKRDLAGASAGRVVTIRSVSGRAARGLRNRYVEAMEGAAGELPGYPFLNALTAPLRRAAAAAGRGDLMSEWCGQGVPVTRALPAAELVRVLADEYRRVA
ncbi:MAG TPA: nitronate monooxygenase [Rhodanobacter sp.]|nr:nitronate monooxygenase [Rhodanobacter sp.]